MNVALYLRTSTEKQDTSNQLRQLSSFCETQGWTVGKVYTDIASGKNGDRTAFKALFVAASRREFDLVLFWSLDRFSREGVFETLRYLQTLTSFGVGYRSYTEQYLDSCGMFRDAVISILAVIAKQERVRLSERTIAGLVRARAQGKVLGRRPSTQAAEVQGLVAAGLSLAEVSRQLGVSKTSIFRALRRAQ
jgi:DNA invertase Pin-like site-specific DNA recombinase